MSTTTEENEQVTQRINEEVWEQHNFDAIDELVAEDYVLHDQSMPEPMRGREVYREMAEMGAGIIDGPIVTEQLISIDDYVIGRWSQTGEFVGEMMGIEPTHEEVTVTGIDINRFEDGKLAETWQEVNILGMLMQIGALPDELVAAMEMDDQP
ncbi:ester cyclase [Haladaptatus sp. DYF46]|uniref:ester cyclase n=1 Tax=Haladaptatus sp. DYF46 TaxID=2886041 RepID=UPI001E3FCB07|nr:ester cyclase [Haladaptatus sp. DYF46]